MQHIAKHTIHVPLLVVLVLMAIAVIMPSSASAGFVVPGPGQPSPTMQVQSYPLSPQHSSITRALDYLRQAQQQSFNTDGRIAGFNVSAWAVMAIATAGEDPHAWVAQNGSLVDYLSQKASVAVSPEKATDYERMILAIVAAGENPRDFGGIDFIDMLLAFYDGSQIGGANPLNDDCWGILALESVGESPSVVQNVRQHLLNNQNADGGWPLGIGLESDADNTAAAISALIAAGEPPDSPAIVNALEYLKTQQEDNGGFISVDASANTGSTTWAITAMTTAGQNPLSPEWTKNGNNPVSFLLSMQNANGSFKQTPTQTVNPEWMTAYAIAALLAAPYPRDSIPPLINDTTPLSGTTIDNTVATISAAFSDATSGINSAEIILLLDGVEVTSGAGVSTSDISYDATGLNNGEHSVQLTVRDYCGNEASEQWSFLIQTASGNTNGDTTLPVFTGSETIDLLLPGTTSLAGFIDGSGAFTHPVSANSEDNKCILAISKDTIGLAGTDRPLDEIIVVKMQDPPSPQADLTVIGTVYDIGPDGATFEPPVSVTFSYNEAELPETIAEEELYISVYDSSTAGWVGLESSVDTVNNTVTASASHLCAFAVTSFSGPAVAISNLTITPAEVTVNENVEVSVLIANNSPRTINYEVKLLTDSADTESREIALKLNESKTVTFVLTGYPEGEHFIQLEGLQGTFVVRPEPAPPIATDTPPAPEVAIKPDAAPPPTTEKADTPAPVNNSLPPPPAQPSPQPPVSDMDIGYIILAVAAALVGGITGFYILRKRLR